MANKVLLANNKPYDLDELTYPLLASPKFDGNRLIIRYGELLSRKLKPQKNRQLPKFLKKIVAYSRERRLVFDGEFYSHDAHFTEIQSMRGHNWLPPEGFCYCVFDCLFDEEWESDERDQQPFRKRAKHYTTLIENCKFPNVCAVTQTSINSADEAREYFQQMLDSGYEGAILRDPDGAYKHGRSTVREGIMFKMKNFATTDAVIIGFEQRTRLTDEYRSSDRGLNPDGSRERSGKKEFRELVPDEIGAACVRLKDNKTTCNVTLKRGVTWKGLGITWKNRRKFISRWVEFEYQPEGTKDRPRMGRIVRLRPDLD